MCRTTCEPCGPRSPTPSRGIVFANRIVNARKRQTVRFSKQVTLDPDFKAALGPHQQANEVPRLAVRAMSWSARPPRRSPRLSRSSRRRSECASSSSSTAPRDRGRQARRSTRLRHGRADGSCPTSSPTCRTRPTSPVPLWSGSLRDSGRLADFTVNPQAFIVLVDHQDQRSDARADGRRHPVRADPRPSLGDAPAGAGGEEEIERYAARLYKVQNEDEDPLRPRRDRVRGRAALCQGSRRQQRTSSSS